MSFGLISIKSSHQSIDRRVGRQKISRIPMQVIFFLEEPVPKHFIFLESTLIRTGLRNWLGILWHRTPKAFEQHFLV